MGQLTETLEKVIRRLDGHTDPSAPFAFLRGFQPASEVNLEAEGDEIFPRVVVLMPTYSETLLGESGPVRKINRLINLMILVESSRARHGVKGHCQHIEAVLDALDTDPQTGKFHPVMESMTCLPRHTPVSIPEGTALDFSLASELTLTVQLRSALRGERRNT